MSDPIRVLIVEDDFAVARLHRSFLEQLDGFEVVGAELTAEAAASRLAAGDVDLALLDMFLPDASGLQLLRRIRAASATPLDVIMVTAAPEPELVRQALELGAIDYVLKPFQQEDFSARLRRYAARRAQASALPVTALSQEQIDALQGRPPVRRRTALPKGLSESTARVVADDLQRRDEPAAAAEIGETLGMSRVSARRYLEYFLDRGDVEVKPKYGDAGRPQNLYRWVSPGL
ncbi:response regulator [Microbacterium sp. K2]|uniref:response regulator n=1 Tax=Microbacterium sp. K2 TaxID=3391827 RepID=UPI003ED890E5